MSVGQSWKVAVEVVVWTTRMEGTSGEPTVAAWYAKFLVNYGIVDEQEVITKFREKIRIGSFTLFRKKGPRVTRAPFDQALRPYPKKIRESRLAELGRYIYIDKEYIELQCDPY